MAWALSILALPVLYGLSIGPVVYLMAKGGWEPSWLTVFYEPLEWCGHHTPLGEPLRIYVNWWRNLP